MLIAAAAAVLVAAGAAGATIGANIFTITPGNNADLVGTHVLCFNDHDIQTGLRAFTCGRVNPATGNFAIGTYGMEVNTRGIVVQRWDHTKYGSTVVHTYCYHRVSSSPLAC